MADQTPSPRNGGSDIFKVTIANAIRGVANTPCNLAQQWISLHTGDPLATGANEIAAGAGNAPGYKRMQVNWKPAVIDEEKGKITADPITFEVPGDAAKPITHYAVWNVETGNGNGSSTGFLYGKPLSANVTLSSPGKVTITPTHLYGLL